MIVPIVLGFGLYAFTGQAEEVEDPNAPPTPYPTVDPGDPARQEIEGYFATQTAEADASLTPVDYDPYAGAQPTPVPPVTRRGDFHEGAWVRVNAGAGDCLNARNSPSLDNEWVIVNICIPDGYEGAISGNAQEAEGHWWWELAGLGWVAEDYLVYVREFDTHANVVAELSGVAGKIAFMRGNDIWVMNPDGSSQTMLLDNEDSSGGSYVPGPRDLAWSPDGTKLSYNVDRFDPQGTATPTIDLHVLTVDGAVEQVYPAAMGGGWSADGVHIGIIREPRQEMGSVEGIAAILDVRDGGQLVLGSDRMWQQKPPEFNRDGTLLMVHEGVYNETESRASIAFYAPDGMRVERLDFPSDSGTGYASPAWSPVEDRLALHNYADGRGRYTTYDVAADGTPAFEGDAAPPKTSERIGGRCGGGDMWQTVWSLDGRRVLYTFNDGDTGANGVWSWDIATGGQRVLHAYAGSPTAGPGNLVMFSAGGFLQYGTSDGGFASIITDGHSPTWWVPTQAE
jgi:hypothetical protein